MTRSAAKHATTVSLGLLLFFQLSSIVVGQGPPGAGPAAAVQVGVVTLHPESIPVSAELPGRVSASQTADVRPQVGGIIKSINFRAGQTVTKGDVLYEIESATYDAQVAVQEAAVQKAQAGVTSAQAKVTRYTSLASTQTLSQSDLEDAQVALAQAQADVASAKASLRSAQLNVDLTKVTAPISGLISDTSVPNGTLVTAAQTTALATIRQLDPAYVDLVDTSANLLKMSAKFEQRPLNNEGATPGAATVHLQLEDDRTYDEAGALVLADVVVSESTGTFGLRATFPNPRRVLLPGMFVRATVDLGSETGAYRVPQRSVSFDAKGQATALFVEDGKAVSHDLTTTGTAGNNWIVTSGISDGAQLIVDGFQKVSAGSAVTAVPVTLDADGVATDTTSASTGSSAPTETSSPPESGGVPSSGTSAE